MGDETIDVPESVVDAEGAERPQTRRRLLQAAGVAAGAVAASRLLAPETANAADGGTFTLGQANTATSKTSLATSGPITNDGALSVTAAAADYGVFGSGASYGVVGSGPGGVLGLGTVGGVFSGSVVAINLDPQAAAGAPAGQAFKGDMAIDSAGILYMCIAAGTPGTWIKVSHGGVRPLAVPQRAFATSGSAVLRQGERRTIPITGTVAGIPTQAVGIVGNLTIYDMLGGGYVTLYPAGGAQPGTSSINWNVPAPSPGTAIANAYTVGLGTGGQVTLFADATVAANAPATQVILDVTAYIL